MNQEVLDALTELQNGQESFYVSMDTIVEEVFATKNAESLDLEPLRISVRKSLTQLTRNGILQKSGKLYTRSQLLPATSDGVYNTVSFVEAAFKLDCKLEFFHRDRRLSGSEKRNPLRAVILNRIALILPRRALILPRRALPSKLCAPAVVGP